MEMIATSLGRPLLRDEIETILVRILGIVMPIQQQAISHLFFFPQPTV